MLLLLLAVSFQYHSPMAVEAFTTTTTAQAHPGRPRTALAKTTPATTSAVSSFSPIARGTTLVWSSPSNDNDASKDATNDESSSSSEQPPQASQFQSQDRPLDPLFTAVTKMDPDTAQAPSVSVPLWGDLILDKSLFVLLPIAGFAIVGVALSVYILIHSGDVFVQAVQDTAVVQSGTSTATTNTAGAAAATVNDAVDSGACRGLCRSQESDLEGLRTFMSGLSSSQ